MPIYKLTASIIAMMLLCSCGQGSVASEQQPPELTRPQYNRDPRAPGKGPSTLSQHHGNNPETVKEGDTPPLEGGPEKIERPKAAADNSTLARLYPDIIVLHAPRNSKRIALTFDDGPDQRFTPKVLDILKKHNVKATFFLVGARVEGHPDVTKRIHDEGHIIGNHSYWHPKLTSESVERMSWEVKETDKVIQEMAGYTPRLFRAPYGSLDKLYVERLAETGNSVIGWSVDSLDWKQIPSEEVQHNIMSTIHPGAIVLMHSAGDWTQDLSGMTEALDEVIPKLKRQGYELVTIPELLSISYRK